ncbi:MAG TPA: FecR family protein [Falsiroseomonas sp.]|jgi:ferric-dicitrate binding protein FerR (iron transport regulator)|nr:FecR family protein [Falsiroseomonas sp.]
MRRRRISMTPAGRRALLGLAALLPAPALHAQRSGIGRVEALRGSAVAEAAGARRDLAPAASVFDGDLVATAEESRMTLRLAEAMEIRLGAAVRLRIDRFLARVGGTLVLERGAMLVDRPAGGGTPPGLAVRGPFGLIAVRGTRFFAGPSNGVFGVFVERGSVLLAADNQAVEIMPGFGADIRAPGAAPTAPVRWGAPRIAAALASVG